MKITEVPVNQITVTQRALADAFGVTPARINQLVKSGVIIRDVKDGSGGVFLYESTKNYWRTQAPSAGDDDSDDSPVSLSFNAEKALHEKVKRELAELKLAKLEGRVYEASTVELVMTEMLSNLRTQLLGLPAKLAPILDGRQKEEIYSTLTKEIESKLMDLSEYTPELFTQELIEDEDVDEP